MRNCLHAYERRNEQNDDTEDGGQISLFMCLVTKKEEDCTQQTLVNESRQCTVNDTQVALR